MVSLRAALEIAYSTGDINAALPYVIIMSLVFVGGNIGWYLLMTLVEFIILNKERGRKWVLTNRINGYKEFQMIPFRSLLNVKQVITESIYYIGVGIIVWIAGAMAGFNPWTTAYTGLGISIIISSAFNLPLSLRGSGYCMNTSAVVSVGQHLEVHGLGQEWSGRVSAIHPMWIQVERYDEVHKCGEIIEIPTSMVLGAPRKRNFYKEFHGKRVLMTNPGNNKDYLV